MSIFQLVSHHKFFLPIVFFIHHKLLHKSEVSNVIVRGHLRVTEFSIKRLLKGIPVGFLLISIQSIHSLSSVDFTKCLLCNVEKNSNFKIMSLESLWKTFSFLASLPYEVNYIFSGRQIDLLTASWHTAGLARKLFQNCILAITANHFSS